MAIVRYEPWGLLNQLQRELTLSRDEKAGEGSIATAEWAPAVDIKEEVDKGGVAICFSLFWASQPNQAANYATVYVPTAPVVLLQYRPVHNRVA